MTDVQPDPTLTINIAGADVTLFMSYGLLNRLLKKVGSDIEALTAVFSSDLRDALFIEALTKRGKSGVFDKVTKDTLDDLDMSNDDAAKLSGWLTEAILSFFISAAEAVRAAENKFKDRTAALTPQPSGTAS